MQQKRLPGAERYIRENHHRGIWEKIVGVLACVVVFCTTYALILPAITLEKTSGCGLVEHTHSQSCYVQVTSELEVNLVCTYESLEVHSHTEACYDSEGGLICGYADYLVHQHDALCLDESGKLVCPLAEVAVHEHTDACYKAVKAEAAEEAHFHDDSCYSIQQGALICQIAETEGHRHDDSCYTQSENLVCKLEESEGHTHGEKCREPVLVCTNEEEGHIHDEGCWENQITCTTPESEGHAHTFDCYEKVLNCGLAEADAHQHSSGCYEQKMVLSCQLPEGAGEDGEEAEIAAESVLVCTEEEVVLHTHSEECLETYTDEFGAEWEELSCGRLETEQHSHSDACFETVELPVDTNHLTCQLSETEGHTHTELCYGTWELVCQLEEHTHSEECESAAELTEEELAQVDAVIAQIDELESAEQVEAKLSELEAAEDWEGYAAYLEEAALKTQTVRDSYNALSEAQKQKVTNAAKLIQLDWLVPVSAMDETDNKGRILPSLDGDWAYITDFIMKKDSETVSGTHVRTGTSPWDSDNEAGNDQDEFNDVLRTFDIATYSIQFNTKLREATALEDVGGIKQGRLYFEFVLPLSAEKVQFDTDTMGWLKSSQDIRYEVVTQTVNGVESQVLRGSFLLVPTGSNEAAIGASTNELSVVVRALQMNNGDKIKPIFTLWLEHNEVGATYDPQDPRLPETIVTGLNHVCNAAVTKMDGTVEKHDLCEAATLEGTEITISARPMFNIAVVGVNAQNTKVGVYDFNATSNTDAINYGLGSVEGRLNGYGLRIELRGKPDQGMRGAEFPDENTPITFDIKLTSSYKPAGKTTTSVVPNYLAKFWSGDMNAGGTYVNADGRKITTKQSYINSTLPFNKRYATSTDSYKRCTDGGTWTFTENDDGTLHVVVSDFVFDTSAVSNFPYSYTAGDRNTKEFYDPDAVTNYWEISKAVFSAGELWVVQPFYGLDGTDDAGIYIADALGEGQFYTKVEIVDLYIKSVGNQEMDEVSEQSNLAEGRPGTADDDVNIGQYLKQPGGIDGRVVYIEGGQRSASKPLTAGGSKTDIDWATAGTRVTLASWINHDRAEENYVGVAYDNLIKFDDEFFLPDGDNEFYVSGIKTGQSYQVLWAALPNGGGWTDDEHMKSATPDDLVFYSTLSELYAAGKTPVGIMVEVRGVGLESGENHYYLYVDGTIRNDCEPEQVYLVTRSSYAWHKQSVGDAALEYHNAKYSDNQYTSTEELTDADYNEYIQDSASGFPSRSNSSERKLFQTAARTTITGAYPKPFWWQDYYHTSARPTASNNNNVQLDGTVKSDAVSALMEATKATYNNGVYEPGIGAYYYQDSCLVIPYNITITKSTAQSEKESAASKSVYDMGQNQRTVDYVLNASIDRSVSEQGGTYTGAGMTTTVYVEDTLPAALSYIPGSAYFGGTYTQDPSHQNQGTCTGEKFESTSDTGTYNPSEAHPYLETISQNADGTTTIRWMFNVELQEDVSKWTGQIYFSCSIGTPGIESTDVKDGQGIDNTVKIWSSDNDQRPFETQYGNIDTYGITINKLSAVSLSEISDQLVMDWWDEFGFTKNVGNNSGNSKSDTIIVNTLPFDGVNRSNFTGQLVVTEFSAALIDENSCSLGNFKFYYTTSDAYVGLLSSDYHAKLKDESITLEELLAETDGTENVWHELTFSSETTEVAGMNLYRVTNLPSQETQEEQWGTYADGRKQQITAIIAVGDLPAGATLKMHVTVRLPEGAAGDYMVSYLSQESLSSYARAQAVNRSLEGLTWLDQDADGVQDSGEERISGVLVVLYKLNESTGKYEQYHFGNDDNNEVVNIETGQMISVMAGSRADAEVYDEGRYKFTDLPAGTYAVQFQPGRSENAFDISTFVASPQDVGDNDTVDSDALPTYADTDQRNLKATWISGIEMKEAKDLTYGIDESKYHDSGFYYRRFELPETGGTGTAAYTTAGLMLMLFSTAYLLFRQQKRRREGT